MGREAKINNKLTRKQTVFVREFANGKSGTQAAMTAYNVENSKTASVIASQNLSKLSIKEALEEALRSNGLSLTSITSNIGCLANSKPEKISGDTVLKANTELLKLMGVYPDRRSFQMSVSVKTNIASMTNEEVDRELKEIDRELVEVLEGDTPGYTQNSLE